jgi:hypothetical protein
MFFYFLINPMVHSSINLAHLPFLNAAGSLQNFDEFIGLKSLHFYFPFLGEVGRHHFFQETTSDFTRNSFPSMIFIKCCPQTGQES